MICEGLDILENSESENFGS